MHTLPNLENAFTKRSFQTLRIKIQQSIVPNTLASSFMTTQLGRFYETLGHEVARTSHWIIMHVVGTRRFSEIEVPC